MADDVLSRLDLLDLILGGEQAARFSSRRKPDALKWLAVAYQDVWDAADWTFKIVDRASWYTSADGLSTGTKTSSPLMPASFASVLELYDDNGWPLDELSRPLFGAIYQPPTGAGRPVHFNVVNRQVRLGPSPDLAYLFSLSYRRRMAHRSVDPQTSAISVTAGAMAADTSYPLWDDHHYVLVPRAQVIGLQSIEDPNTGDLEDQYASLLTAMISDYVEMPAQAAQYGRVAW